MFKSNFLALCTRYQETKDSEFRNNAIELAVSIAEKYVSDKVYFSEVTESSSLSYDDILSYAYEGLVISVDKYLETDLSIEPQNYIYLGMMMYVRKYIAAEAEACVEEQLIDQSDEGSCIDYATDAVYQVEIKEALDSAIESLPERLGAMLRYYFEQDCCSYQELSDKFDVSYVTARQCIVAAFRKIRLNKDVMLLYKEIRRRR